MTPFPDNTRYAAIGDSITHNGWYLPYIELYYLTRFPSQRLNVFNCGINGDSAEGGWKRYHWDIKPHRPTQVSLLFGMNDVGRDWYAAQMRGPEVEKQRVACLDRYETNLRLFVKLLQEDKIEVIMILPTIFDDTAANPTPHYPGLNEALGECARRARRVAEQTGCPVIDFYHPMLEVTTERQAMDPAFSMIDEDRTHPGRQGDLFMAYTFLRAQNVPAEVAGVSIDGGDGHILEANNCRIDHIKCESGSLSFRYLANALPFPIESETREVTTWVPFVDELNREIFRFMNLPSGVYELRIDQQSVRNFSSEELARGVNLATENATPQAQQAQGVWKAYKARQEFVFKLRTIASVERAAFEPMSPQSMTLKEMEPRLDAYMKKVADSPWEKAIAGEVDAYRLCKPHEAQIYSQLIDRMETIRCLAQPVAQIVEIHLR